MKRRNFFVDDARMDVLGKLADREDVAVSALLREGIDRIIADRLNSPRPSKQERIAAFDAFLNSHAGTRRRTAADDEALIDQVVREKKDSLLNSAAREKGRRMAKRKARR